MPRPRFRTAWGKHGLVKWFSIYDRLTGHKAIGRDWRSWDAAQADAYLKLARLQQADRR